MTELVTARETDQVLRGAYFMVTVGLKWHGEVSIGYQCEDPTELSLGHLITKLVVERPWWSGADLRSDHPTLTDAFGGEWLVTIGYGSTHQFLRPAPLQPDAERAVITYYAAEAAIDRARHAKYEAVLDLAATHTHAEIGALLDLSPRSIQPLVARARKVGSQT